MRCWRWSGTPPARSAAPADLGAIATLGFRGEALPSIASVSRFRLRTRLHAAPVGFRAADRRRQDSSRPAKWARPSARSSKSRDLFFNLPARRKFLKADTAESAQISRLVTQLALGYCDVGFVLKSGARVLLEAPPAGSLEERFYQVYGDRPDLVPVAKQAAGITVTGFVAALGEQGPARGPQHVFVNQRIVRDRTISHAIQQAYSVATIKERSPEVHLFIEISPDRVDVNVHPTKAEVRFLDQGLVHEVLRRAIVDALGATGAPELVLSPALAPASAPQTAALPLGLDRRGVAPVARPRDVRVSGRLRCLDAGRRRGGAGRLAAIASTTQAGRTGIDADPADGAARPVPQHVHHRDG